MTSNISIPCPKCHKSFPYPASKLSPGVKTKCPHCKTKFQFTGDDVAKLVRDIKKSINAITKRWK